MGFPRLSATRAVADPDFGHGSAGPSRLFPGSADQVGQVRRFVRSQVGDHPAADDVVLAASELASNAIKHTASGRDSGMFLVQLTMVGPDHVAVIVTDQGTADGPQVRHPDAGQESGRGLAVVEALACLWLPLGDCRMRSMLAVVGRAGCQCGARRTLDGGCGRPAALRDGEAVR
jgi:hypothetical protein